MTKPDSRRQRQASVIRAALILCIGLALPACGGDAVASPSAAPADLSGAWTLDVGTGPEGDLEILENHPITLSIEGSEISGSAACNSYGARIERPITGGVTIGEVGMTAMGCDAAVMASEAAYVDALSRVEEILPDGERLVLRGDDVTLEFVRLPPVPTAELVGTTWLIETVVVGDVAAAPVGDRATLLLTDDGGIQGSTGCRSFTGAWVEADGQIQATRLAMGDEECAAEIAAQDSHVVSVIGDGFRASVEGDLLTLMDPGGVGLVYRAED